MDVSRRTALKTGLLLSTGTVVGVPTLSGSAAARPAGCDVLVGGSDPSADAATVQAGINLANPGDTVCVNDGTYIEQVIINKDLTVKNAPGATPTIVAPPLSTAYDSLNQWSFPESEATWKPVVLAFGGSAVTSLNDVVQITGTGTVNVSVSGFTIDGDDEQPPSRAVGILFRNVRGIATEPSTIENNVIENMGVGSTQTFGIIAYGDSDLQILRNDVSEYERGGITANGDGGAHPAPTVDIRENTVTGTGATGLQQAWPPRGIQVAYGAGGEIVENVVEDNRYSPSNGGGLAAVGILVDESDDIAVMGNTVTNSDAGIGVFALGQRRPSADRANVVNNTVEDAHTGIFLAAETFPGDTTSDPSVSNAKVVNNTLTHTGTGDVGVLINALDVDPNFDPVVANNKVINNTITDYATQVSDGGTGTKVRATKP